MKCIPPHTPLLCNKLGAYRGIPIFLTFDPKHRLWVLVRTASVRRSLHVPTINVLSNYIQNIKIVLMKFSIFTAEKILSILHGHVFVKTAS